jgi:hypothetical protein
MLGPTIGHRVIRPLPELVFLTVSLRKQGCQLLSKYLLPAVSWLMEIAEPMVPWMLSAVLEVPSQGITRRIGQLTLLNAPQARAEDPCQPIGGCDTTSG